MTRDQLLASLKPLEWEIGAENYPYFPYSWEGKYQFESKPLGCSYLIDNTRNMKYELKPYSNTNIIDVEERIFNTIEEAKAAAQKHYNNLVLELFNLKGKQ